MIIDPEARIDKITSWGNYYLLSIESPSIASKALPGQFIMIRVSINLYPLLRRPFGIHSVKGDFLEIFFQESGLGTRLLSQKKKSDDLDILGPLGIGFNVDAGPKDKPTAVLGGGRGIAPLYFLAQRLRQQGKEVKVFYGGRSRQDLPLKEKFQRNGFELFCSTDDGSYGYKSKITDLFQKEIFNIKPGFISACGPEPMLKQTAKIAGENKIQAELSLESIMGCGFGVCWGCVKKIKKDNKGEWRKICTEGPVFPAEEIIWQDEEK